MKIRSYLHIPLPISLDKMDGDLCDEHPKYGNVNDDGSERSPPFVIQDELLWGASYRHTKKREKENALISPKVAPLDVPFALCRAKQRKKRRKSKDSNTSGQKSKKLSLLEKSMLPQNKYMEYLSIPNPKFEEPPPKKSKKRCEIEPCPPRLVQLAVPTKRRVFENWKCYYELLPTEMIMRFEQLLHTDKNLEPRDARYYYKKIDKERKKLSRTKRRLKKKKQKEKERGDRKWVEDQMNETVKAILDFIKEEPLFALNYKQLMISDGILNNLDTNKLLKKPKRTTKNWYKLTLIEVCDKLALWMDTLTKFVDVQAVESDEDIPPLTISSLEEGEESEEEDESESESMESSAIQSSAEDEGEDDSKKIWESVKIHYEGEDGGGEYDEYGHGDDRRPVLDQLIDRLDDMGDEDLLNKLIELFESSPEEFLMNKVDRLPDVTYMDILDKLRALRGEISDRGPPKSSLEEVMLTWANDIAPEKVDKNITKAIHEFACQLGDKFRRSVVGDQLEQEQQFVMPLEDLLDAMGDEEEDHSPFGELDEIKEEDEREYHPQEGLETVDPVEDIFEQTRVHPIMQEQEGEEFGGENYELEDVTHEGAEMDDDKGREWDGEEAEHSEEEEGEDVSEGTNLAMEFYHDDIVDATKEDKYPEEDEGYEWQPAEEMVSTELVEEKKPADVDILFMPEEKEVPTRSAELASTIEPPPVPQEDQMIKGHTPSVVLEHSPSTVCCLSLKIWAVWLLEITHNAHTWTKWVHEIIKQVRDFASVIRGEVVLPDGQKKTLKRDEWLAFVSDTEEKIVAWRQYSSHVKMLSGSIIDNFHGKKVNCCPKCLEDHLIKNVVTAHETLQALTDAMNCAGYWQRCLDNLVNETSTLTELGESQVHDVDEEVAEEEEESDSDEILEEFDVKKEGSDEDESIYEIEELDPS